MRLSPHLVRIVDPFSPFSGALVARVGRFENRLLEKRRDRVAGGLFENVRLVAGVGRYSPGQLVRVERRFLKPCRA